jgi:hypothetical protein
MGHLVKTLLWDDNQVPLCLFFRDSDQHCISHLPGDLPDYHPLAHIWRPPCGGSVDGRPIRRQRMEPVIFGKFAEHRLHYTRLQKTLLMLFLHQRASGLETLILKHSHVLLHQRHIDAMPLPDLPPCIRSTILVRVCLAYKLIRLGQ